MHLITRGKGWEGREDLPALCHGADGERGFFLKKITDLREREREREKERESSFCTYLCIRWLLLVYALT